MKARPLLIGFVVYTYDRLMRISKFGHPLIASQTYAHGSAAVVSGSGNTQARDPGFYTNDVGSPVIAQQAKCCIGFEADTKPPACALSRVGSQPRPG